MSQVWLITGSSRGLGHELAGVVLAAGNRLVATARRPEQLDDLVQRYGERVRAVALDVTDPAAAQGAVHAAVETFGRLDVVVNNAGYANVASIEEYDLDDFRAQVETNFFGVVNVTQAALPVLRGQGGGHVIQVSSVGDRLATPGLSAYQSAKWAVAGFSEVLAGEVGPLGIRVTVVEPGGMRTDWAGSSMKIHAIGAPYRETVGAMAAMHANFAPAGDPEKVAQVILALSKMDQPPLRLLLGSDAFAYAVAADQARAESDVRWRELSESTDHDEATAADLDPLGSPFLPN